jgi:hypothetical protein
MNDSPTENHCACVHDDAKMCIAIRYDRAYDAGLSDESVLDDEECTCCCHQPTQEELDAEGIVEDWIEENRP